MNPWLLLLAGWGAAALVMLALWCWQLRSGDASPVDVSWSICVGLLAVGYALFNDGYPPRRLIVGVLAGVWSLRLALYLLQRIRRLPEDGRYQSLRERWGTTAQRKFFLFFQVQAFWSALFSYPMLLATMNPAAPLGLLDLLAVLVWLVSVVGESSADRQLWRFRQDPTNRGQVCRDGLWRYSRHPNYFFEWLHWWCYVLLGWQAPAGWLTLGGPLIMLWFLFKITGIPPTEEQALRSRGDAYRAYQRTTSAFFPWPPRQMENSDA